MSKWPWKCLFCCFSIQIWNPAFKQMILRGPFSSCQLQNRCPGLGSGGHRVQVQGHLGQHLCAQTKVSSVFLVSPVGPSLFIFFSLFGAITKMLCLWFPLRLCLICSKLVLFPAGGNRHYFEIIKHIYDKIIIMNTAVPVLFWNIYNLFSAENTTRYCRFSRKSSVFCCICWVLILIVFNLSN